jgi:cytochrome c oxidase subunit 2
MGFSGIDPFEKRIISIAIIVSIGHLLLVGYAAAFLNISVPTCQPNEKLFTDPSIRKIADHRYEVHYLARMWAFEPRKLVLPRGSTVDFFLASKDVNHGFQIDRTNVNLMAVPGVVNSATHTFRNVGIYPLICHEYCGVNHQNMFGEIEVSDKVLEPSMDPGGIARAGSGIVLSAAAELGKKLYTVKGCFACHNITGASGGVGPSFRGLYGRQEELQSGDKVAVDDQYITESIKLPKAKVVKGFAPLMPPLPVSGPEILSLIEFIKAVK